MRTDQYRTSQVNPEDYKYLFSFSRGSMFTSYNMALLRACHSGNVETEPVFGYNENTGNVVVVGQREVTSPWGKLDFFNNPTNHSGCTFCGAHHNHGDVWHNKKTDKSVTIGHICATKYSLMADRAEFIDAAKKIAWLKKQTKRGAVMIEAQRVNRVRAIKILRNDSELLNAFRKDIPFVKSIRENLWKWGNLSDKQIAAVKNAEVRVEEPKVPALDGKAVDLQGTVVSTKWQENDFGGCTKMLVKISTPAGVWMTWGSVPVAIEEVKKNDVVSFRASKLIRSNKDEAFSFFSRPTRAVIVKKGA